MVLDGSRWLLIYPNRSGQLVVQRSEERSETGSGADWRRHRTRGVAAAVCAERSRSFAGGSNGTPGTLDALELDLLYKEAIAFKNRQQCSDHRRQRAGDRVLRQAECYTPATFSHLKAGKSEA